MSQLAIVNDVDDDSQKASSNLKPVLFVTNKTWAVQRLVINMKFSFHIVFMINSFVQHFRLRICDM